MPSAHRRTGLARRGIAPPANPVRPFRPRARPPVVERHDVRIRRVPLVGGDPPVRSQRRQPRQRSFEGAAACAGQVLVGLLGGVEAPADGVEGVARTSATACSNAPSTARISSEVCSTMKLSNAWRITPSMANSVSGEHSTTFWPSASSTRAGSCLVDERGDRLVGQEQQHVVDRLAGHPGAAYSRAGQLAAPAGGRRGGRPRGGPSARPRCRRRGSAGRRPAGTSRPCRGRDPWAAGRCSRAGRRGRPAPPSASRS